LCTVVVDICVQAQPAIAYQARIDGHGVRVCLCHGCLSVENSKLVITIVDTATSSGKTIETVKYHPPTLSAMWPILENNYSTATGVYSRHKVAEREPSPLDNETRRMIGEKVFAAYQPFAEEPVKRRL